MPTREETTLLTVAEAADKLRLGAYSVRELCKSGALPAYKPEGTGRWLIDPTDLDAFIKAGSNQKAAS